MTYSHYVRFIWLNAAAGSKVGSEADAICDLEARDRDDADRWALETFTGNEAPERPRYGTCNDGVLRRTATADRIEFT